MTGFRRSGGALTPLAPATVAASIFPAGVAVSPDGQSVYVTNRNDGTVSQYSVGSGGALSAKTPATVATGSPFGIAVSPDGQSVYVTNAFGETVSQYSVGSGGALSAKTPATVATGGLPVGVAVSPLAGANLFLHTDGVNLFLDRNVPTDATADFRDSAALKFAAGNAWKTIGTWAGAATEWPRTLTPGKLRAWLGLKNSDDQGTRFDLRAEVLKNGVPIASGTSNCITGVTRNPANATDVSVPLAVEDADIGPADALSLRVSARIGTNPSGAFCGGHSNATGLRLYFDAASRPAEITLE